MRARGEAPQSGTYTLLKAQLASQVVVRVRGEPPKSGGHTLSESLNGLSQEESKR